MSTSKIFHLEDYFQKPSRSDESESDSDLESEVKFKTSQVSKFYDVEFNLDEEIGAEYQEFVKEHCQGIRRGDLIALEHNRDRNSDVLIWDGNKAQPLSGYPDEYGCVPREFSVITEFPINYWLENVCHNCYVPFCHQDYLSSILSNLQLLTTRVSRSGMDLPVDCGSDWQIHFTHKGINYEVPSITYVNLYKTHFEVNSQKYEIYIQIPNYFKEIADDHLIAMIRNIYEQAPMSTLYYHAERDQSGEDLKDILQVDKFDLEHSLCLVIDLLPSECSFSSFKSKETTPILSDSDRDELNQKIICVEQHKLTHYYKNINDIYQDEALYPNTIDVGDNESSASDNESH
jgi:hypothetical protein